jgi:hypothetical protein
LFSGAAKAGRKILHQVRISSDHDQPCLCRQLKKLPIFWLIAAFLGSNQRRVPLLNGGKFCPKLPIFRNNPAKFA